MKKNEFIRHREGIEIKIDEDEAGKAIDIISNSLIECEISVSNVLAALCCLSITTAYKGGISKPHFLNLISGWWEEFDHQQNP